MPLPAGFTRDELIREVVESPRRLDSPLADTIVTERPGWKSLLTPSLKQGALNEVAVCVLRDDEADAVIDATIAAYRAAGCRFKWYVRPGSAPADLAERLERRGFTRHEVCGVVRDLSPVDARPCTAAGIEPVDLATVDEFTDVMAKGWEMDVAALRRLHRRMLEVAPQSYRMFLARAGAEPVGVATYTVSGRAAYQMGAIVLPSHRRLGIYHALVAARIADAASRGLALATSQARADTSAPILASLGFETVCRFPSFFSPAW